MDSEKLDDGGGMDRISSLPLHILHHIMSRLPIEEVTRTGILSKAWNGICASYPNLDFDMDRFNLDKSARDLERFLNHVNACLSKFSQQKVRMQKLRVMFAAATGPITPSIIEWLKLALEKGVEEIWIGSRLSFSNTVPGDIPMLPLRFQFWSEKYTVFDSVKKVDLQGILLDEATFDNLFAMCPLIEDFELHGTSGLKRLHIPKVKRLAKLLIRSPNMLEVIDIEADSIRELTLVSARCISPLILASNFPILESLLISLCCLEDGLQIISPSLKILDFALNDVFKRFEIDTPNLRYFSYSGEGVPRCIMTAPCQRNITIIEECKTISSSWFVDMKYFLARSTRIIKFDCHMCSCRVSFSLEEAQETNLLSVPVVEKMRLQYDDDYGYFGDLESDYTALLNGILWCCHPKIILVCSRKQVLTKFLCKQFEPKGDQLLCCSSTSVKCWRHDLKEVKWNHRSEYATCFELTW